MTDWFTNCEKQSPAVHAQALRGLETCGLPSGGCAPHVSTKFYVGGPGAGKGKPRAAGSLARQDPVQWRGYRPQTYRPHVPATMIVRRCYRPLKSAAVGKPTPSANRCVLRCGTSSAPVLTSWSDRTLDVGGYLGSMNCGIPQMTAHGRM
jgi:hypothetical protein